MKGAKQAMNRTCDPGLESEILRETQDRLRGIRPRESEGTGVRWSYCGGGAALSFRWGGGPITGDRGGEEGAVFDCSFSADHVADLDIGEGDGVAAFAEGGVFVGEEGVGGVIGSALQGHLESR